MSNLILLLDNIRSSHNVGSILRSAACFGVEEVILGGVTPAPVDRFGRASEKISKVALGGENLVSWRSEKDLIKAVEDLKKDGWTISALEQAPHSISLKEANKDIKRALILGEETKGVSKELLEISHEIIEIPQEGKKESLNVSVATGIALFVLTN